MNKCIKLICHKGNDALLKTLKMSILSIRNDTPTHIHVQGLRGTGKTTIIRSMKQFLPQILRVKGCQYNCHPRYPLCPDHKDLSTDEISEIGIEYINMPFLEISHSAKIGTVVGSIDLEKISDKNNPVAGLLPGSLPRANRGIIFIDEINRLADTSPELVDVLLDVMGTKPGRIQIEETGLKIVEIPLNICVWAASNPDEEPGALEDIRKQLSDRFDLVVDVERPREVQIVKDILSIKINNYEWGKENISNIINIRPNDEELSAIDRMYSQIKITNDILTILASIYVDYDIESIRGIESLLIGAMLHSALNKRKLVTIEDLYFSTPLALKHRTDISTLTKIMRYLENYPMETPSEQLSIATTESNAHVKEINTPKKISIDKDTLKRDSKIKKVPYYQKILKAIREKFKNENPRKQNVKEQDSLAVTDPNMIQIKSLEKKAIPIKEIELKNLVKTQEELYESESNISSGRYSNKDPK